MKKLKTGLASFGLSGRAFHYPFLAVNKNIELKKIVIRNAADKKLPPFPDGIKIVPDFDNLINDPEIELIVVNTPDYLHYEMAKKALLAGKHVVIEKPFTKSIDEAKELLSLAEKKDLVITPYQNRRFDGDFMTVKSLIDSGTLKDVIEFRSTFSKYSVNIDRSKWREKADGGSGAIYNIGSHLVDQAVSLFGIPESVLCISREIRPGTQVDDFMVVTLFYKSMTAELRSSYVEKIFSHRFHVNALNGSFMKFGIDPQEALLRNGSGIMPVGDDWGEDVESNWGMLDAGGNGSAKIKTAKGNYHLFYDNVYKAINGIEGIEVSPDQVIAVLKILKLCEESGRTGKVIKFE
jgi:predicted dehydrogenase